MEYAGRLHRFAAFIVDAIIISVVIGVLSAIGVIDIGEPSTTDQVLEAVISFGYYILLTAALRGHPGEDGARDQGGRTRMVRRRGSSRVLIRETVGKLVSAIVLFIGFIWILFDDNRQGWHDKIGGTFVVKAR